MKRPTPIVWFERYYLGAVVLKVVVSIINWDIVDAGGVEIGIIVSLLLWFGVMYRHSAAAKWILIVLFLVYALWTLLQMSRGAYGLVAILVTLAAMVLNALAVWQLLVDDAQAWFDKTAVPRLR